MIREKLNKAIRTIPDFPKRGIDFKDITPLFKDSNLTDDIIDAFVQRLDKMKVDAIVGIESRGFLFGFLLANRMKIPFIPIRKSGKLPGETLSLRYDLEYGSAEIEIHKYDVKEDWNVVIHDDLLATGGTACAAADLLLQLKTNILAFTFVVNLDFLDGKIQLEKYKSSIISLIDY